MRSVTLNKPYLILQMKRMRYVTHYGIPAEDCLVVPVKDYGDDVSCDVRWEDGNGELQTRHKIVFIKGNLVGLNQLLNAKLQEIWNHYYNSPGIPSINAIQ